MSKKFIPNKRQDLILNFLEAQRTASISTLMDEVGRSLNPVSKITINRDLKELIQAHYIASIGAGRALKYTLSSHYKLIKPIDLENYFAQEIEEREMQEKFNFDIFSNLTGIFTQEELLFLDHLNKGYLEKLKGLSSTLLKKEFERLTIEFSWKSSRIEGNTYSLLETEQLIRENQEAKGRTKHEAIMILNHKHALDFVRSHLQQFKQLTIKEIEAVHSILIQDLGVPKNIRHRLVGITGTRYKPLDNSFQIKESLEVMCRVINSRENVFEKALLALLLIAYIQPFEDGNKRTSRLIGNALLLSHKACPLSYRSIDEQAYKKAVLLFYEQNNLSHFKHLFIDQFEFATKNYFL